jgi:hypothetical protein
VTTFKTYMNPDTRSIMYSSGNVSTYVDSVNDVDGNKTRLALYMTAGADGIWFSADDVPYSYTVYTFDAGGRQTRRTAYNSAGTDITWFTADDPVNNYSSCTYDANGNKLLIPHAQMPVLTLPGSRPMMWNLAIARRPTTPMEI